MRTTYLALLAFSAVTTAAAQTPLGFSSAAAAREDSVERLLLAVPDTASVRAMSRALSARPHLAGSPQQAVTRDYVLDKLRTCDMVIGSRYVDGGGTSEWGLLRPVLSWLANKYISLVAGIPVRDTTSGYRGYRREVLEAADFDKIKIKGYVVHGEMAYQAWLNGFRLGEVPIHFRNRRRAASKLTREEIYMALVNFALLRRRYGTVPRKRQAPETETP